MGGRLQHNGKDSAACGNKHQSSGVSISARAQLRLPPANQAQCWVSESVDGAKEGRDGERMGGRLKRREQAGMQEETKIRERARV